jgi:hypothetical protein
MSGGSVTFQRLNGDPQPGSAPAATVTPEPHPGAPVGEQRVGRLSYASADVAWPGGAAPLARWLRSNPDVLSDLLGTPLQATSDEVPGGLAASVFVDDTGTRTLAVLELGPSSEQTLGSLLTRLTSAQAGVGVWICGEPRDEHVSAASWLNHSVAARFYIARIRAARIDSSAPAPILQLVLRPPRDAAVAGDSTPVSPTRRAGDHSEIVLDLPAG